MKNLARYFFSIGIAFALLLTIGSFHPKTTFAEDREATAEWLGDYTYTNSNGMITLKSYNGEAEELTVPGTVEINGNTYVVHVGRDVWRGNRNLKSITFEEGVMGDSDLSALFYDCSNLTTADLSGLDTSNVTDMTGMFSECTSLTEVDVSGFDTSNVTRMNGMFYHCESLPGVDVSGFETSKVLDMIGMFSRCNKLASLDVSGFDTFNVVYMSDMFGGCESLTELDVSGFDTSNATGLSGMFSRCKLVTSLDVSGFDTSKVTNMQAMFSDCSGLTELDVSGFDTSKVTDMSYMFNGCSGLTSLDVSGFDTSNVTKINGMFTDCKRLANVDLSGFEISNVTDLSTMFYGCNSLTGVDLSGFDTSQVTNMRYMFSGCSSLTELDVSGLDTSHVKDMSNMFAECGFTSLDLTGFDTSSVTNMTFMFYLNRSLVSLDLSGFDVTNVTNMSYMIYYCDALTELDLSGWDMANVTNAGTMLGMDSKLEVIHTPKAVCTPTVSLPAVFYDENALPYRTLNEAPLNSVITKTAPAHDDVPVTGITLSAASLELPTLKEDGSNENEAKKWIFATVAPDNASNKKINWTSSNPAAVSVNAAGRVTVLAYSTEPVIITATAADGSGVTATCQIQTRFWDVTADTVGSGVFKSVYWAADNGITSGYNKGEYFGPELNCSRQEFAIFMYRIYGKPAVSDADISKLLADFTDVASCSSGAKKAIAWAYREGIISGSSGLFNPNTEITREQIAIMLWRASGKPAVSNADIAALDFTDLSDFSNGGKKAIAWAVKVGVIKGFSDGHFGPRENCTRAQIAVMLYRMYK